jgi:hypothetical protein
MTDEKPKAILQIGPYVFYNWAATLLVISAMFLGAAFFLSSIVLAVFLTGHSFIIQRF